MKSNFLVLIAFCLSSQLVSQPKDMFISKLTAINATSYTDVIFAGIKDTVLVSTFSGRIGMRINGVSKEKVIANVHDEIYSLAYHPKRKEIVASTLENGILLIKFETGAILKKLPLKTTWSINVFYSDNYQYLITHDQKGNRYIWDVKNDYKEIAISNTVPPGRIVKMDDAGWMTIVTPNKLVVWDFHKSTLLTSRDVQLVRFGDMDKDGHLLSVDFNECAKFNTGLKQNEFVVRHPNRLRDIRDFPNYQRSLQQSPSDFTKDGLFIDEGYSMQLTMVRFAKNYIYTASIDRSIRQWNKETGALLSSLTGHRATVNKIRINTTETQMVSIDLKGGIRFWAID